MSVPTISLTAGRVVCYKRNVRPGDATVHLHSLCLARVGARDARCALRAAHGGGFRRRGIDRHVAATMASTRAAWLPARPALVDSSLYARAGAVLPQI